VLPNSAVDLTSQARGRKYVYWSEVQFIPTTDLATLEALWLKYSRGKFGYTVQRRAFNVSAKGNFEAFCRKVKNLERVLSFSLFLRHASAAATAAATVIFPRQTY
jgi:hypothetical protein